MVAAWWVLTGGDLKSWWLAALLIGGATASSYTVTGPSPRRWHPGGLARFAWFFAYQSLVGGVDVARRAFSPSMPIKPGYLRMRLRADGEAARVMIADTASLLPGTVVVMLDEHELLVHALDTDLPIRETLADLDGQIRQVVGEPVDSPDPGV